MNFFTTWFGAFLRSRRSSGLFGRQALLDTVAAAAGKAQPVPEKRDDARANAAESSLPS